MGFSSISEYAAADEAGQVWTTQFRKAVASAATTANAWVDYTYFAGSPPANFYASTPLAAAVVDPTRGLYLPSVAPATQHLNNLQVMTAANSATSTANGRQQLALCDYLLYYPFIDTDAVGEQQDLNNTVPLPRYSAGQVIAVAQCASSAVGQYTMTYTNQDGVSGRVSQNTFTFVVAGGGQIVSASGAGASYSPFVYLQAGDSGVRSIESVTFTAAGGGLMALVIVKPLLKHFVAQECRRTTSGNLESYGACAEFQSVIHAAGAPQIKDGAVLGLLAAGYAGSLATSILAGIVETFWN
ncbi:MAG TPA: hypothetical protein VLH36_07450 [Steroidobacteraceae bacterium]|nr:hypothetical protein [Steroidobacteraceae bacterium]